MLANISNRNVLDYGKHRTANFGVVLLGMNYFLSVIIVHIKLSSK
jgi:hypothetical protein